ncbi:MAG: histidine phosphatase family protein [Bacillota bacterium]
MTSIYLIRHGRTEWNKEEVFRGTADIPLDDLGRRQAQAVGKVLKGKNIKFMISSPLSRALETATISANILGSAGVIQEPQLADVNFGEWQGLSQDVVKRRYPQLYRQWITDPANITFPGGESLKQAAQRSWASLIGICQTHPDCSLAVFTHRVINKILLMQALGCGLISFWKFRGGFYTVRSWRR